MVIVIQCSRSILDVRLYQLEEMLYVLLFVLFRDVSGKEVFVLGDTSYGQCCVDEVAAQHLNADAVIHFGHTCLTPPQVVILDN